VDEKKLSFVPPTALRLGSFLTKHGVNLNKLAKEGKIDPVVGREEEIERAMQILCRRTKNNPVFVGDPGVGKTAVAEGLAWRLITKDAPDLMLDKVIISLDLPSMLAGTKFRGEFEERLRGVIRDVAQANGRVILFIDEIHLISGAGSAEGAIDASNMLKPALARGQLRCMGATTTEEYSKHIEKDAALARRFQTIVVSEPTIEEAVEVLTGIKDKYEKHHGVIISDDAVEAAVRFSDRYIPTRRLPDKAIDLIDEAASRLRMRSSHRTPIVMEEFSQSGDADNSIGEVFEPCDDAKNVPLPLEGTVLTVSSHHIGEVTAAATGLPVGEIKSQESQSLLAMEDSLKKRLIGQDSAVESIARCIRISRAGLRHHDRPLGVFLLLGPSGTGKTELAKSLSEFLFTDENAMLRIDMSEYGERFNVSRLTGAPPGYIGYEEGGILTESIRHKPYSVILLDEFEKAHKGVSNLLLQVFDEGRLRDSHGRVVDFRNTVIIMTSNIGQDNLYEDEDENSKDRAQRAKEQLVERYFSPEFVNRIDEIICFNRLSKEEIRVICDKQVERLVILLEEKDISFSISSSVADWLAEKGYDPLFGARPLKRLLQSAVLDPIATLVLQGSIGDGSRCHVELPSDDDSGRLAIAGETGETWIRGEVEGVSNDDSRQLSFWFTPPRKQE
jgi:ATP-dependent Clp protease ATP-binding subunit ClpC